MEPGPGRCQRVIEDTLQHNSITIAAAATLRLATVETVGGGHHRTICDCRLNVSDHIPLRQAARMMKRLLPLIMLLVGAIALLGADGCASDPNVEGAKLDLRNKDYDRALENITKALERNPDNAEALSLKGQILQDLVLDITDTQERSPLISEMVDVYLRSAALDPVTEPDIERRLGSAYRMEYNRGIELYNEAQNKDDEDKPEVFQRSAAHFRNASMIFPDSTDAYFNEASAFFSGGMAEQAIGPFEMALEMGSTLRRIYIYLATIYGQMAEAETDSTRKVAAYKKLVRTLEPALANNPRDEEIRHMLLNGYALAAEQEKALNYYREEINQGRATKVILYNYGTLLLGLEAYDEAITQLIKAVAIDSLYGNARFNLGAAYVNKAAGISAQYTALDDSLQANRTQWSARQVTQAEASLSTLHEARKNLFQQAITHLEVARNRSVDPDDTQGICRVLFQAYGHTDQRAKTEAVRPCAAL